MSDSSGWWWSWGGWGVSLVYLLSSAGANRIKEDKARSQLKIWKDKL